MENSLSTILPQLEQISFYFFAGLVTLGALGVVFHRSIVYNAIFLLITFLSIAGIFVLLNAPFIAAAQIMIYGVGMTIVMIFGIMLTGDTPVESLPEATKHPPSKLLPSVTVAVVFAFFVWAMLQPDLATGQIFSIFNDQSQSPNYLYLPGIQAVQTDAGVVHIAKLIFTQYLIPFELASILLLLATIGAVILSKKELPEEEGQPLMPTIDYVPTTLSERSKDLVGAP